MTTLTACRSCGSQDIEVVWDLGIQPIANELPAPGSDPAAEPKFPLAVAFCRNCALMQVTETVPAEVLFGDDYPYYSSVSAHLLEHSRQHAEALIDELGLGAEHFVLEVASNDGYLLKNFVDKGIPILGVDPAAGPARAANQAGIDTIHDFFSLELAKRLAAEGRMADVVLANNVAAHVDAINDFMSGIAAVLKPDGIAEIEVAYLLDLVDGLAFDTIYHEHLFYHSLIGFEALAERNGLYLNHVVRLPIHGGSIRMRLSSHPGHSPELEAALEHERALGMGSVGYYRDFSRRMDALRIELNELLAGLKAKGKRVVAYGAAAKGATLLNFLQLPEGTIDYVVDLNPHKVGKLMPGVRLMIEPVDKLMSDKPDYVLVLAWNFAKEIVLQQGAYGAAGGTFILPLPTPKLVRTVREVEAA